MSCRVSVSDLWHNSSFKNSEERSSGQKPLETLDKGCAHRHKTKATDKKRKVVFRSNDLQQNITRHFDEHVDDVEDGRNPVEPYTNEVEILCHALDTRVSDVGTIQIQLNFESGAFVVLPVKKA